MAPTTSATVSPSLDPVLLGTDLTTGDRYDLEDEADLEGFAFADLDLDALSLRHASVFGSRLDGVRADEAERLAECALGMETARQVGNYLRDQLRNILPQLAD